MPKHANRRVGNLGENLATRYLKQHAFEIIDRNYRWARGEIDIVAKKENTLIFVEVKTARQKGFGSPESWVDERKQRQIGQVAQHYLQEKEIEEMDCRFDVVAITKDGHEWKIHHIQNAFWL
ncbi:MAG: YraN family protein [bacterium]